MGSVTEDEKDAIERREVEMKDLITNITNTISGRGRLTRTVVWIVELLWGKATNIFFSSKYFRNYHELFPHVTVFKSHINNELI